MERFITKMSTQIKLVTKLENGSLQVEYMDDHIVNLPGESYTDKTVQAALIMAIVNKKD